MARPAPAWPSDLGEAKPHVGKPYEVRLITPMFGGGVKPGSNDEITPIRGTSIRGHLRLWWRATRGTECANLSKLHECEGEIWGTTNNPSPVRIWVERPQKLTSFQGRDLTRKHESLGYVLYSLLPNYGAQYSFRVFVDAPADLAEKEVEPALRAWFNLGGLGARTRRGCGALHCEKLAPSATESPDDWLGRYFPPSDAREWPVIGETLCLARQPTDPLEAWGRLVQLWREFRREAHLGETARMASPILLRPFAIGGPRQAVPVIVRLEEPLRLDRENSVARDFLAFARARGARP